MIWMVVSYGIGLFPPGKVSLGNINTVIIPALRDYISAHAAMSVSRSRRAKDAGGLKARSRRSRRAIARSVTLAARQPARESSSVGRARTVA